MCSPDNWFKVILLGKSMLPLEDPPLTRQQFAICLAQSEAELSLDLLLVNGCDGSEFRSSIHKNLEARVLKVFTTKCSRTSKGQPSETQCSYNVGITHSI